jgi:dTDP-glucose 4,6-dehydratase
MRVLLTGGCGFLGSHIVEHFLKNTDASVEIVILDKLTYASNGFDRLRDIGKNLSYGLPDRLRILGCDLSQPVTAGVLREIGDIDYIIHAAAESHVDNSIRDPLPFLMSNVVGTHYLLMLAMQLSLVQHLRRIFIVSTDEVYGPASQYSLGFVEGARFRPANPYAASKAGAECVAMAYANTYGLPITIVNTMNLIGERQHPEKYVPKVIRSVLRGDTVTIHADATKTRAGSRFYLHCRTFAHALHWLIQKDAETFSDGLGTWQSRLKLHVCGEREIDNLELAQIIAGYVGKPLHYELVDFHSSRPGHDLRYAMDDSLIRKMGWERPMGLKQSLEKTVRWYLDHPQWLEER